MPARSLPWFLAVAAALFPWADAKTTAASNPPQPRTDLNGDPLPPGAVARLGAAQFVSAGGELPGVLAGR